MKKTLFILFITLLNAFHTHAQDPISSQYLYNRLDFNPSFTGYDGPGRIRANAMHRNQFNRIKGPFTNSSLTVDYGLCNLILPFGIGLVFSNELQGDGLLNRNDAGISFGSHSAPISLDPYKRKYFDFAFGMESGFIWQSVDWSKFVFSDQLDPIRGQISPSSNASANWSYNSQPNFNAGAQINFFEANGMWRFNFGFVASNIFEPSIGLLNNSKLPRRYTGNINFMKKRKKMKTTEAGMLVSSIRFDYQELFKTSLVNAEYFLHNNLSVGLGARISAYNKSGFENSFNFIFMSGIHFSESFRMLISGEFVLINGNNALTFELGLLYIPKFELCRSKKNVRPYSGRPKSGCFSF